MKCKRPLCFSFALQVKPWIFPVCFYVEPEEAHWFSAYITHSYCLILYYPLRKSGQPSHQKKGFNVVQNCYESMFVCDITHSNGKEIGFIINAGAMDVNSAT